MKKDFIPDGNAEMDTWEETFITQFALVAASLGFSPQELQDLQDAIADHRAKYTASAAAKAAAKAANAANRVARKDTEKLIREAAARAKAHPAYTEAMGQNMGLIGAEEIVDWNTAKPVLKLHKETDKVVISFNKISSDGVVIFRRLNTTSPFTFLGYDTESPFEDGFETAGFQAPETREYYASYMLDDEIRGLPSDTVKVSIP